MIYMQDGQLTADNSDWYGYYKTIQNHTLQQKQPRTHAVILGAGGATRGVLYALHKLNIRHIIITNRTIAKAEKCAHDFQAYFDSITICDWNEKNHAIQDTHFLINTTSLGLKGDKITIPFHACRHDILVSDIVYNPLHTPFLSSALQHNLCVSDGLNMLIYQAVPGFKRYFKTPNVPENIAMTRDFLCQFLQ